MKSSGKKSSVDRPLDGLVGMNYGILEDDQIR